MKYYVHNGKLLDRLDAYWSAVNYLTAGQMNLFANSPFKHSRTEGDLKDVLRGHGAMVPGIESSIELAGDTTPNSLGHEVATGERYMTGDSVRSALALVRLQCSCVRGNDI